MNVTTRLMVDDDWSAVEAIYLAGIATGDATFETESPGRERFLAAHLAELSLVAELDGAVVGWAAASAVSDRCVYGGVVEHGVYVDPGHAGEGIGRRLLDDLVRTAEDAGIWTVQSGIFPENVASLAVHEAAGFRVVGTREKVGCHHGRWRDVVLVERRSERVGV